MPAVIERGGTLLALSTGSTQSVTSQIFHTHLLAALSSRSHGAHVDVQRLPPRKTIMVLVMGRGGQQMSTSAHTHLPSALPVTNHLEMHSSPESFVIFMVLGVGVGPGGEVVAAAPVATAISAAADSRAARRPML